MRKPVWWLCTPYSDALYHAQGADVGLLVEAVPWAGMLCCSLPANTHPGGQCSLLGPLDLVLGPAPAASTAGYCRHSQEGNSRWEICLPCK